MFDIAWSEMIVIGAVALIAIGPKDLPKALRAVGAMTAKARRMAAEFQDHFREAMREAELESVRQEMANLNQDLSAMSSGIQSEVNAIGTDMPAAQPAATPLSGPAKVDDTTPPVDHPSATVPGGSAISAAAKPTSGTTLSVEASPAVVTVTETAVPAPKAARAAAKPARKTRATAKGKPRVAAKAETSPANGSQDGSKRAKAPRKRVAKASPLAKASPPQPATEPIPPGDDRAA